MTTLWELGKIDSLCYKFRFDVRFPGCFGLINQCTCACAKQGNVMLHMYLYISRNYGHDHHMAYTMSNVTKSSVVLVWI